ncbi:conserved hypothetical protein [Histoplasma capsulatum G186AR]|uniref:NmrA-like domain-containing protein n=2 Tax=Ajellomyces capsulatus TaxID=5037 RepID=C0NI31_AJECG|nr:uncharacterized protein HCBG_03003 [Histoplasma capsulatum G186AR]EEH09466.1 conserved hypothetical protein [Histoplasma capsulatum G186AR]KAG5303200.1 isoflavone reductase family protein [Histoplasma capsulatum]QSS68798.1 isoflavone reductase family protein [Histoplasma capsulatum G186AR]
MIKVAIAGTSGLSQYIAHYISTQTCHQFIFLSRNNNPGLTAKGWQVLKVDYSNSNNLQYALAGIDTVISTISGQAEIALIDAAAHVRVRRFVPSEFEGPPSSCPAANFLDRGNLTSLGRLQYYSQRGMQYAVFACGIFYERFAPGGMATFQLGSGTYIDGEGDYLMNVRTMKAEVPYFNASGAPVFVCMTSAQDLARYIVAALDLPQWETEFRICGDRMTLGDIVSEAELMRGVEFEKAILTDDDIGNALAHAKASGNLPQQSRLHCLLATVAGCYDFGDPNLHTPVQISPQTFRDWLRSAWAPVLL